MWLVGGREVSDWISGEVGKGVFVVSDCVDIIDIFELDLDELIKYFFGNVVS